MIKIEKIVCPTDFSDASRGALRYAVDLAKKFDAELTLLHVYQVPGYTLPEGMVVAGPATLTELANEVDAALAEWKAEAAGLGCDKAVTATAMGSTHQEIIKAAEGFDLIVMGTHGRKGIKHALLGSVAEKVVRGARCPVLTLHIEDHDSA
jgi:nucleotide-binding universal stress UspA family protein